MSVVHSYGWFAKTTPFFVRLRLVRCKRTDCKTAIKPVGESSLIASSPLVEPKTRQAEPVISAVYTFCKKLGMWGKYFRNVSSGKN